MALYENQGNVELNLIEELSEVIQVIAKKNRFGGEWNEIPPGHTLSRLEQLENEMSDVMKAYIKLIDNIKAQ